MGENDDATIIGYSSDSIERRIDRICYQPKRLYASAIVRVSFSTIMLFFLCSHVAQRDFLFGVDGQTPWTSYDGPWLLAPFNLFNLSPTHAWFESVFWGSILVCVLYLFGIGGRLSAFAFAGSCLSICHRLPLLPDGGINLLSILALYMIGIDSYHYLALRVKCRDGASEGVSGLVHNACLFAMLLQIAMLYFWSDFYKITGHAWQDGTALYYILRVRQFALPGVSELIYMNGFVVTILTYFTLVFQAAFPFLMWIRAAKLPLFLAALIFHLGIAVLMGLPIFSAVMIAADTLLLHDCQVDGLIKIGSARLYRTSIGLSKIRSM